MTDPTKMTQQTRMLLIKVAYWLGIGADALWAVALLSPSFYAFLIGRPDFKPDLVVRLIMGTGASLMTGWTFLLVWAVQKPVERRFVILLTALVVVGLFVVALISFLHGNVFSIWILIKTAILIIAMMNSYILAGKMK